MVTASTRENKVDFCGKKYLKNDSIVRILAPIFLLIFCQTSFCELLPQKVIVCGVCKDVANRLPVSIKIIEKIGELFADYRAVVYENNSSDDTSVVLARWCKENPKIFVISEQLEDADLDKVIINKRAPSGWGYHGFFKTEMIARARNIVLERAMSPAYDDFTYLIWMDMDFVKEPAYGAFKEIFSTSREWDAVFAYGIHPYGRYYDWYAFRDKQYPLGPELLGDYWWQVFKSFKFSLTTKHDWYPVFSAFCGCGIYKKESVRGCKYSGIVTFELEQWYRKKLHELQTNFFVGMYRNWTKNVHEKIIIPTPVPDLPDITDANTGIVLQEGLNQFVWRMGTNVHQYPVTCEHVTLHAAMAMHGHDKLFINPRLLFFY